MQTYFDSSLLAKNIDSAGHNQTVEDTANETNNDGESVHQPWREILVRSRRKSFQAGGYKLQSNAILIKSLLINVFSKKWPKNRL